MHKIYNDNQFSYLFLRTVNSRGNSKYEKRPFTCNKCQYKSSKLELLQRHVELKCGIKSPTKFKCDKCSYKTIRKRHLKRHQLTHGGQRPWICGICKKEFTEKTFLKYHMFKHRPSMYYFIVELFILLDLLCLL